MKILVIGGTGFIGRHLVYEMKNHHEVIVLHRGSISEDDGYTSIKVDRRDLPFLRKTFEKINPEIIIDLIPYFAQDAWDMLNAFRGVSQRIIALSSGDAYRNYEIFKDNLGTVNRGPSKEEDALRQQLFPYRGINKEDFLLEHYDKILVEKVLQSQNEINVTILRLGAVYGAFDSQRKLKEYIQPMIQQKPRITIYQEKANWKWTRVFVKDVVQAIMLSIESNELSGHEIFNVGESTALSQIDLLKKLKEIAKWNGEIEVGDESSENFNYQQHLLLNTDKIRQLLGYRERFSLEERLSEAIAFEKSI